MPRRRVLTERELNRALLARQMLLGRVSAPLPKVLDRMGTLQAQYAPSMYIGLWTRMEGFEREQLDRALERRSVVQGTLMRATIHLVSEADYWPVAIGVRRGRREAWLNASYRKDYSASQMAKLASKLRRRLGGGTISRKEIHELLGSDSVLTNGVNMWLDLVRVPPSGTWERRRADLYAAAEHWVGPSPKIEEADGIELLVRRYFGAFGPATLPEAANWAGLHPKRLEPVCGRLKLRRFEAEDGAELLDLARAPLPDPETPAPVRFLPTWDASLLAHARRAAILPEEHRSKVFNAKTPQSVPTFLVDGRVAGTWSYEKGRVKTKPFRKLDASARRELRGEADRLAELHMD
ncbi:MAG: winged helix DNA-binding domain-containing protein [Solirubrobacterales bacterium]